MSPRTEPTNEELEILADIREALGVGHKPMASELPGIVRELVRKNKRLVRSVDFWMIRASDFRDEMNAITNPDPNAYKKWLESFNKRMERDSKMALDEYNATLSQPEPEKGGGS